MMNMNEIENRINELEDRRFFLSMKDHWSDKDYELDNKLAAEIAGLKELVA